MILLCCIWHCGMILWFGIQGGGIYWQSAFMIWHYVAFGTESNLTLSHFAGSCHLIKCNDVVHIWHYVALWYDGMIWCCVKFGIAGGGIEVEFFHYMFWWPTKWGESLMILWVRPYSSSGILAKRWALVFPPETKLMHCEFLLNYAHLYLDSFWFVLSWPVTMLCLVIYLYCWLVNLHEN